MTTSTKSPELGQNRKMEIKENEYRGANMTDKLWQTKGDGGSLTSDVLGRSRNSSLEAN